MRLVVIFFNKILRAIFPAKLSRPEDVPKKLNPEALAEALAEARNLSKQHAVRVKDIAPDETPGLPRRADQ